MNRGRRQGLSRDNGWTDLNLTLSISEGSQWSLFVPRDELHRKRMKKGGDLRVKVTHPLNCAGGNRTSYLQVMSLASYRCSTAQRHHSSRPLLSQHVSPDFRRGHQKSSTPKDFGVTLSRLLRVARRVPSVAERPGLPEASGTDGQAARCTGGKQRGEGAL